MKNRIIIGGLLLLIIMLLILLAIPGFSDYDAEVPGWWVAGNEKQFLSYLFRADGSFILKIKKNSEIDIFTGKWKTENGVLKIIFKDKEKVDFFYSVYKEEDTVYLDIITDEQVVTTLLKLL